MVDFPRNSVEAVLTSSILLHSTRPSSRTFAASSLWVARTESLMPSSMTAIFGFSAPVPVP